VCDTFVYVGVNLVFLALGILIVTRGYRDRLEVVCFFFRRRWDGKRFHHHTKFSRVPTSCVISGSCIDPGRNIRKEAWSGPFSP